jgi:lysophospholipase L1-like esterase
MMRRRLFASLGAAASLLTMGAAAPGITARVAPVPATAARVAPLTTLVNGRVLRGAEGYTRQWPGSYFETAFRGKAAIFRVGAGEVRLHLLIDGRTIGTLVKPRAGFYRVDGLMPGRHRLRVEVASESQAAPTTFGGFFAPRGTTPEPIPPRRRQIEFIGDSHTVGYANTSNKHDCTEDEVWATTDTSRAFGPILARRHDADYEINAISGRGVVRNYNGFAADKMPEAYPFVLFDKQQRAERGAWHPQVIVVALGTNDFSTALHAGEPWPTRAALHADFEATYLRFVRTLRARDPQAFIILWATDMAAGEIEAQAGKVAETLRADGDRRVAFAPIDGLSFAACHNHPSLIDEQRIADRIDRVIALSARHW